MFCDSLMLIIYEELLMIYVLFFLLLLFRLNVFEFYVNNLLLTLFN